MLGWTFICTNLLLGTGLAMDAFSVSLANGLNESRMKLGKMVSIAGIFAVFQALMPMIGWICIHTVAEKFEAFQVLIPWIALLLLCYIGGKMLYEGMQECKCEDKDGNVPCMTSVGFATLMVQGIATSIDALSVGFAISEYDVWSALFAAAIIAMVTFIICLCGVAIGKKFGTKFAGKASVFGGAILILIGIEIFVENIFF